LEQQSQELSRHVPQQQWPWRTQRQYRVSVGVVVVWPCTSARKVFFCAENPGVYGRRECGYGSPGAVPELPGGRPGSRIYVTGPRGTGRLRKPNVPYGLYLREAIRGQRTQGGGRRRLNSWI